MTRKGSGLSTAVLVVIFACYAVARVLEVLPTSIPRTAIVALDVLSAMMFALVHGAQHYRLRGILVFAALCLLVGNAMENLSLTTGFPFGRYKFLELMGPKLFQVPFLLGLAYVGMAYVSWTLARLIVGRPSAATTGFRIIALPLVASFIMVAWDLAQDPVWATLLHGWIWRDGGAWFGVPVSNYFGWFLTVFLIYLLFSLYLRGDSTPPTSTSPTWWPAILFYALCAAGNVLQIIPVPDSPVVRDAMGVPWRGADITAASALVSIFVMGAFIAVAAIRLIEQRTQPEPAETTN
jgi:putative membrane protein